MVKKITWGLQKLYLWTRSIVVLKSQNGVLLASYPKTGSTWVRYFLYLSLRQRREELVDDIDAMNAQLPEFAHISMFKKWGFNETKPLIKTHQCYHKFFGNMPSLLIIRDPRDIVVSYYHYVRGLKNIDYDGSFSEILRHKKMGLEAFLKHYDSWRSHAGLIVKYEDLKNSPIEHFSQIVKFCGMERNQDEIIESIEGADFSAMKKAQERSEHLKSEFKEGHEFVRSGKKAQWMDLFSDDDVAYYESLKVKYNFHLYD